MAESSLHFVGTATLQALTGNPVFTDLWDPYFTSSMAHIELSRNVEVILVAPATADFIAKLANGLANDLLSTLCLARDCPLLIAPAMNRQMWENPATQRNIAQLKGDGVTILGPSSGAQACGETGMGRMLEPQELLEAVRTFFKPRLLQGKRVLVTAGPTYEAIDAVRGITNSSSGKMGYAVAQAALDAGARVVLISGPVFLEPPAGARLVKVTSACDMLAAVEHELGNTDIFVSVAAVADYRPIGVKRQKMKKNGGGMTLELVANPDILEYVAGLPDPPFCVGFAAETEDLDRNAEAKRNRKKLPLLAGNLAQDAIGTDDSDLTLYDDAGTHQLGRAPKIEQARRLVEHIALLVSKKSVDPTHDYR
jgi:phosphopantothenoylcysteine decarboxylase/phosphopantothenate--cysteine ligase